MKMALLLLSATGLVACGGGDEANQQQAEAASGVVASAPADAPAVMGGEASVEFLYPAEGARDVGPVKQVFRPRLVSPQPLLVSLAALPQTKTLPVLPAMGEAQQVGVGREVAATQSKALLQQLHWQPTEYGGQVGAIQITSAGAKGVRLGVLVDALPGNARLRVYGPAQAGVVSEVHEVSAHEVLQLLSLNRDAGDESDAARTWWTPQISGGTVTLELELPRGVPVSAVALSIPSLSHIYAGEAELDALKHGRSASCQLDANCYSEAQSVWNAVARMSYVKGGNSYNCTGTLLNNMARDYTPYFISANHCVSEQTVASTLQTDWFYRTSTCNSQTNGSSMRTLAGGAQLLYANGNYDLSFMRLRDAAPSGAGFAGWSTGVPKSMSVMGVHQPAGDWQKVSFGQLEGQVACSETGSGFSCTLGANNPGGGYHHVSWKQGMTEGGSSGSGLFSAQGALLGVLYGGNSSCSALGFSAYGRFDLAYRDGLHQWLNAGAAAPAAIRSAVYRFYNANSGAHFYSGSAAERDFVISTLRDFQYESVAFYASTKSAAGLAPVYRFYNGGTGAHFYTISEPERDFVRNQLPQFGYEGPSWYARATEGAGSIPVYRFYNSTSGAHFYTSNAAERDFVISALPEFKYESVAYYVWSAP